MNKIDNISRFQTITKVDRENYTGSNLKSLEQEDYSSL